MITAVTIENFKGIREPARIELRPLTLLFGPNNAGKSTLLHALDYAREILERQNLDADRTLSGGESIDLGGFANFVHGRDLSRQIRLRFDIKLGENTLPRLIDFDNALGDGEGASIFTGIRRCIFRINAEADSCWVEFAIAWDERTRAPHVIACTTGFSGEPIATIRFDPESSAINVTDIHFAHPLFQWRLTPEISTTGVESAQNTVQKESNLRPDWVEEGGDFESISTDETPDEREQRNHEEAQRNIDKSRQLEKRYGSTLAYWYIVGLRNDTERGPADYDLKNATIPLAVQKDALPTPNSRLTVDVDDVFAPEQGVLDFTALLTHILASPVEFVRRALAELRHLGPLRHIPARGYSPVRMEDPNRNASGLAAWDALALDPNLMEEVSDWLGRDDRLRSGIRLRRRRVRMLPADLDDSADLPAHYGLAPVRTETVLLNASTGLELQPSEVGVGISQLLPIVVYTLSDRAGILMIEQPELHLHPRIQCEMGDLFISGALGETSKTIIIETHSEHLILRILRRIRETARGKPHLGIPVMPDNVAVTYVGQEEGRSVIASIGIDEHGEFTVPWPDDFFESDFYERFA